MQSTHVIEDISHHELLSAGGLSSTTSHGKNKHILDDVSCTNYDSK